MACKGGHKFQDSGKEPPDKKRKTDQTSSSGVNDMDWGEDDEELFTDDQLDNIDTMISMSQQVSEGNIHKPSHSGKSTVQKGFGPTNEDFLGRGTKQFGVVPKSRTVGKGSARSLSADVVQTHLKSHGTSYSKFAHNIKPKSGSAPVLQTTTSSVASGQLGKKDVPFASGADVDTHPIPKLQKPPRQLGGMNQHQLIPTTGLTAGKLYTPPALPGRENKTDKFAESVKENQRMLLEEIKHCKEELKKMTEAQYSKDGQINILRATLKERDAELNSFKQEKVQQYEQQVRERSEKEKTLSKDLDKAHKDLERANTQLQFKEQEIVELQNLYKKIEQKHSNTSDSNGNLSPGRPMVPQSPRGPKRNITDIQSPRNPRRGREFPTKQSFLSTDSSPKKLKQSPSTSSTSPGSYSKEGSKVQPEAGIPQDKPRQQHRMSLSLPCNKGGAHLVSKMFGSYSQKSSSLQPQGLLGLLQAPPPEKDVSSAGVRLGRDVFNQCFSPARARRTTSGHTSSDTLPSIGSDIRSLVVSHENYDLGLLGVSSLLQASTPQESHLDSIASLCARTEAAVLLIPVIENYITKYLNMLHTAMEPPSSSMSSCSSSGPSSGTAEFSSPFDSVSSSMRALMLEGVSYANQLELYTLNALKLLLSLVQYSSAVRSAIVYDTSTSKTKPEESVKPAEASNSSETPLSPQKAAPCAESDTSRGDAGCSTGCLEKTIQQVSRDSQLLHRLMQIANPIMRNNQGGNADIVVTTLKVLTVVAQGCEASCLNRFQPLVTQEVLLNCLQDDLNQPNASRFSIHCAALEVMTSLTHSPDFVQLMCSFAGEEDCLYLGVYHLCNSSNCDFTDHQRVALSLKVVSFLSSLLSCQRNGASRLLNPNCHCSEEIVQCSTLLLHHAIHSYHKGASPICVQLLHQGLNLLHSISLHDRLFTIHHKPVRHQYVELICGLEALNKFYPEMFSENEGSAIQELWDFDQDYPEGSSEGDEGEPAMDTDPPD